MDFTPPARQNAYSLKYEVYLRSPAWAKLGRRIRNRDGNRCVLCAASKRLNVHHITYERLGRERDRDLLTLCEDCHLELHVAVKTGKTPLGEAHKYLARERGIVIRVPASKAKTPKTKPQPAPKAKKPKRKKRRPSPAETRQRLSTTCHSCRAEVQPDAKHCPKCLCANPIFVPTYRDSKLARRDRSRKRRQEQSEQRHAQRGPLEVEASAPRRA